MRLLPREKYLNKIRGFYHDDGMIKVVTGVRINYGPVLENIALR